MSSLIDTLEQSGLFEELMTRLNRVPVSECDPRVWQALERSAMTRLARIIDRGGQTASFGGC